MKKAYCLLLLISFDIQAQLVEWCVPGYSAFPDIERLYPYIARPAPDLVEIRKPYYEKNPKATYCKRPTDMLDTVVIHHSDTPNTYTAERLNEIHLENSTDNDPWYMIGYSYVINAPYAGGSIPVPQIAEGRPIDIVGSHAGSRAFVEMDDVQHKLWSEGKITCGQEGGDFRVDPKLIFEGKIKANVTTLGVVVVGNFAPFSAQNPRGYRRGHEVRPSRETLETAAKLSCQLQKQYPRIKKMGWHSQYNTTSCPGNLKDHINEVKKIAKGYGCEFN